MWYINKGDMRSLIQNNLGLKEVCNNYPVSNEVEGHPFSSGQLKSISESCYPSLEMIILRHWSMSTISFSDKKKKSASHKSSESLNVAISKVMGDV